LPITSADTVFVSAAASWATNTEQKGRNYILFNFLNSKRNSGMTN